jgi:hypothetical protein
MPLNAPSHHSKIVLLAPLAPLTWTSQYNFGNLHHRFKTSSTSSNALESIQLNQPTSRLRACTTGIDIPWCHLVPRQSFMKMPTQEIIGPAWTQCMASWAIKRSLSMQPVLRTRNLKSRVIASPAWQTCSHSTALPQHTHVTNVQDLLTKLQDTLATMGHKKCTCTILKTLAQHLDAYVSGIPPPQPDQRVDERVKQRVVDVVQSNYSPGICRVSNAPTIRLANNLASKWVLQTTSRTHLQKTRANTPGALPKITRAPVIPTTPSVVTPRWSNRLALWNSCIISQEAINQILINDLYKDATHFIPLKMHPKPSAYIN